MSFSEVVKKVEKAFGSADVSNYKDHLALQFNVTGEGAGIFYIEINEGKLFIAPYDYKDNNAVITVSSSDIVDVFGGKITEAEALETGKFAVEGDVAKVLSIQPYIDVKQTAAKKKATAKKDEPAVKVTLSEEVKKAVKSKAPEKEPEKKAAPAKNTGKAAKASTKSPAKKSKKATGNSKG